MKLRTAEKRRSFRMAAAHPALIWDRRGRVLTQGRIANISETGVFIVGRCPKAPPEEGEVFVEIRLPATATARGKRQPTRSIRYRCRLVRTRTLGHLVGLGVEFIEKIA